MVSGRQVESGSGPIRLGMVGGGQGAFIGAVHRIAVRLASAHDRNTAVRASILGCQTNAHLLRSTRDCNKRSSKDYGITMRASQRPSMTERRTRSSIRLRTASSA